MNDQQSDSSKSKINLLSAHEYNREKQIFLKKQVGNLYNQGIEIPQKTHFRSGASILMNKDKDANHSLNLKDE